MAKKPVAKSTKSTKPARSTKAKSTAGDRFPRLYRERYPERHDLTGKYVFLFLFFAITSLILALTTVHLYSTAHDIIRRYDNFIKYSIEHNLNNNNCIEEGDTNE